MVLEFGPDLFASVCFPPAAEAFAVSVLDTVEVEPSVTAPVAANERAVSASADSLTTATLIAMPTASKPAAFPSADVVTASECFAVAEKLPATASDPGIEVVPNRAVVALVITAMAAEMPTPVPSFAVAPFTALVVTV